MKLLIVDDNAGVRRLIRSIVLPLADDVRECADGAEALAGYMLQHPDVVLMDIEMKEVDGIEATRQITAADREAKVLIVTDYDDDELRQASVRAGACGYVLKQNLTDLVRLLEAMRQSTGGTE